MESLDTSLAVLFQWLLRATLQGSLLVCLILAIKLALRDRLPARWHYCLWLVLLVRLSLPWAPQSRLSIYSLIPQSLSLRHAVRASADGVHSDAERARPDRMGQDVTEPASSGLQGEALQQGQSGTAPSAPSVTPARQVGRVPPMSNRSFAQYAADVVPWLWICGCLALGGFIFLRAFSLWRAVTWERPLTDQAILELLEDCKMQMRVRTIVGVVVTDKVRTPALFGFLRPRILLPQGLIEAFALDDLHHVFLHELAHLKRRDIYLAWLVCLLQVLHWFNPLIWFAFRRMRADQEMAADALALSTAGTDESHRYGRTIVSLLERFSRPQYLPSLAGILENPSQLERRMTMIAKFKSNSCCWSPLAVALIVVLCCISLPNARWGKAAQPVSGSMSGEVPIAPVAVGSDTIVDPNTGLRFTVARRITGENDVINDTRKLRPSPNGKFLLYKGQVVPLDGGKTFILEALRGTESAAWSPDGRLIAFWDKSATWLLPVSPETGRPTGPARRLFDEQLNWPAYEILWSHDSQWILLHGQPPDFGGYEHRTISVQDGSSIQPSDYTRFGLRSPDRQDLAYFKPDDGIWAVPASGGASRLVVGNRDPGGWQSITVPLWWSPDGQWLLWGRGRLGDNLRDLRFVRLADHREVPLKFPERIAAHTLGVTPDGKRLQFYRSSYAWRDVFKVASIRGGDPTELGFSLPIGLGRTCGPFSLDGERWFFLSYKPGPGGKPGTSVPFVATSATADPREVRLPDDVNRERTTSWWAENRWQFSPNGKYIFRRDGHLTATDCYVIPISLELGRNTGPATLILKECLLCGDVVWSPDSSRLAIPRVVDGGYELWVASADGGSPKKVIQSQEWQEDWKWSPDGKCIAYKIYSKGSPDSSSLYVIPSDGGVPKRLWTKPGRDMGRYAWFPNSREIGFVSDDSLVAVNITDGSVRSFLKLADVGLAQLEWFVWSPDGRTLGLFPKVRESGPITLFHASDRRVEVLSDSEPAPKSYLRWTGDSQAIYYRAGRFEKVRPAGLIYEVDIEEAWVQAKTSLADEPLPPSASPIAKLETPPLVDGQFRDDFEDGDTKHWSFQSWSSNFKHAHRVQDGELVLENTRAAIGLAEWRDYVITFRMCIKQGGDTFLTFRKGEHSEYCLSTQALKGRSSQEGLSLGIACPDRARGTLAEASCALIWNKWYTIQVDAKGPHITVRVDGQPIIALDDENCRQGAVTLVSGVAGCIHFDDFSVRLLP